MSSDNYLLVTKRTEKEYIVYERSASQDYGDEEAETGDLMGHFLHSDVFPGKALAWAHRYVRDNPPVEYGVMVADEVLEDLDA